MHAEIILRFKTPFGVRTLLRHMPPSAPHDQVLAETTFAGSLDVLPIVIYSFRDLSFVFLVFHDSADTLLIHVEGRAEKGEIKRIVSKTEEVARRFADSASQAGYDAPGVEISLFSGDYLISTGRRTTRIERLRNRFVETVFGDLVVGILTAILTGLLTDKWVEAAVVGIAVALAFVLWLVLVIEKSGREYEYTGF